jgi:hypothetical protein
VRGGADRRIGTQEVMMLKKIAIAAVCVPLFAASAFAVEPPASTEQCHKLLDDVTAGADPSKLADDALNKLDELLSKAENECEKGEFKEVVQTAEAIKAIIPQGEQVQKN